MTTLFNQEIDWMKVKHNGKWMLKGIPRKQIREESEQKTLLVPTSLEASLGRKIHDRQEILHWAQNRH